MFNQPIEARRRYSRRLGELRRMSRTELIGLVLRCWPSYRHDGVDDDTLIDDILDAEGAHGYTAQTPEPACYTDSAPPA